MEAELIPVSKKHAKRLHTEIASGSNENASKPHSLQKTAPFADLTNSPPVRDSVSARPKRAVAVKAPLVDLSDSTSDEESTSSSDFEPDAEHISENDADSAKLSDLDADDMDACVYDNQDFAATPSDASVPSATWKGTQFDSAQITVFDCTPPWIPCLQAKGGSGLLPKLTLFNEMDAVERQKFEEPDKFLTSCYFCKAKCASEQTPNITATEHFFKLRGYLLCTWPGCKAGFANIDSLWDHYACVHDNSLAIDRFKCDKCNYVANSMNAMETHERHPYPETEFEAYAASSLNTRGEMALWKAPKFCADCNTWYPEFQWTRHKQYHEAQNRTFDCSLPVQGVQLSGLRDGECPFEGCREPYRDFVGWYLHCLAKHDTYITSWGGYVPQELGSEDRKRMPTFRCTTCSACILIGQLQRHQMHCPATMLPETLGPLMEKRAAAYGDKPGLLKLQYGLGVLKNGTSWASCKKSLLLMLTLESSFLARNRNAPESNVLYTVAKIRRGAIPGLREWVQDRILYAGSTIQVKRRVGAHIRDTFTHWLDAGLSLKEDEELYLFRMSIRINEQTSVKSFVRADLRRLEQALIDALGMGTLYNFERVLSGATMLNDFTYRNHIAPRLNQLALVLFESTYTKLIKDGIEVDSENVWRLPLTRAELDKLVKKMPDSGLSEISSSARQRFDQARSFNLSPQRKVSIQAIEPSLRADHACSPFPDIHVHSQELVKQITLFQNERGLTDEQFDNWLRARRAGSSSSKHAVYTESDESHMPACESGQPGFREQRSTTSPDRIDYPQNGILDDVQTTSNGPDYRALEELRASCFAAATAHHAEHEELDESHMPAGESVQSGSPRRLSRVLLVCPANSASKATPLKGVSGFVSPPNIRPCTLRIPRYGGRSTQYVDLARDPAALTQDARSEASHDELSQELSDESSVTSDEEPPRAILDESSESSLDEPSPTDSGFFDFENVPGTGRKPVYLNADNSVEEAISKDSAENIIAALSPNEVDEEEADLVTDDKCAHKSCRRPQHGDINWVQCDDCDKWYHSLCVLGEEMAFEEAEFHCECAQNGKQQRSKKH